MHTLFQFRNPFAKRECPDCHDKHDAMNPECPKCGRPLARGEDPFAETRMMPLGFLRELILILIGTLGLFLVALLVRLIAQMNARDALISAGLSGASLEQGMVDYVKSPGYLAIVNYVSYIIILFAVLVFLGRDLTRFTATFRKGKTYIGFAMGAAVIGVSLLWGLISSRLGATTNDNQGAVIKMVGASPVAAILITGIIVPFIEELIYRVGAFGIFRRINPILAYFVGSVVFGLIHMQDFSSVNNWLSFPDYVIAGFLFAFTYERFGLGASFIAHSTNNLVSVALILLQAGLSANG